MDLDLEETEEIQKILDEIKVEVMEKMEEMGVMVNGRPLIGSCHTRWAIQKKILKERYGIDWKTPQERNPGVRFD